jgi:hypothetical protein
MGDAFVERRRDSTTTFSAFLSGTEWSIAPPESHTTDHLRSHDPAERTWNIERSTRDPVERDHVASALSCLRTDLRPLVDLPWPPATAVHVTLTQGRREYSNSEGTESSFSLTQCDISLAHDSGVSLRRAVSRSDELPAVSEYLIANLSRLMSKGSPERAVLDAGADLPVVLAPGVAGVLLHELVGHAMEEDDLQPGQRLLPAGMSVVAEPPPRRGVDDEGVSTSSRVLVADGRVAHRVRDRMGCRSSAHRPTGHAWASPHAPSPRLRLPNLRLLGHPRDGRERPPDRFLHCRAVRGARYFHGQALLDVAIADLVSPGGLEATEPCRLTIGSGDLADAISLGRDDPPDPFPAGICVKNGEPLPSSATGPTLMFASTARLIVRT